MRNKIRNLAYIAALALAGALSLYLSPSDRAAIRDVVTGVERP